jgi:hypothetical protein
MKLEKLAIALLALYIVYCFMLKEKYAFDEPKLQFPADAGYIDIYHINNKGNYALNKVEFNKNIAPPGSQTKITAAGNSFTIEGFTPKVPKSVLLYAVNYDENKNVEFYRLMDNIDNNAIQVQMKPGLIKFENLSTVALALKFPKDVKDSKGKVTKPGFKDGDIIHTGRFVFTF